MSNTQDIVSRVDEALNSIRPYLRADGGDVRVVEVTSDMVVKLELLGACESCTMAEMTMRAGIEESIKKAIPEIKEVQEVNAKPI